MKKLLLLMALLPIVSCAKNDDKENGGDDFAYPQVEFSNYAPASAGWAIYDRLVPDPAELIKAHCHEVVKTLYFSTTDPDIPEIDLIYYEFTTEVAVSDKSDVPGQPTAKRIRYSPGNVEQNAAGGDEKVMMEVRGVLNHELTHVYQLNPKGAGGYVQGSEHWAFIEGMADAVRPVLGPFADGRQPMPGGTWLSGYSTTGFFLKWLKDTKDADFLKKFNRTAKTINPWSWEAAMKSIFGEETTTQALWDEYQAAL